MNSRKSIGVGSLSWLILLIAIIFSFSLRDRAALGDQVLTAIGLKAWSNGSGGFHYTVIVSIILLFIAWFLGNKYQTSLGAIWAKRLSLWLGVLLSLMAIVNM